ncbi:MAG TPA: MFS transporter [Candidatus Sulfotelmatobacter sp.]|nr:MFS transporter [Candidatus Sulfotelmatobacter sp.]
MRSWLVAVGTVVIGIFILQAGNGLFGSFFALRMTIEHFPTAVIGLVVTGYPLGFLLGCLFLPRLVRSVGHIRAFAAMASLLCCTTLVFAVHIEPLFWGLLRTVTGFAAAGLFMVGESWLAEKATNAARGKVFALYTISNMTAVSASQLMLGLADPSGYVFYMITAGLFAACLIPVALTRASEPALPSVEPLGLVGLYRLSPVAVVGCIGAGLMNTAVGSIGPVYASAIGFDPAGVGSFMAVLLFGGMLLQWPIGRLSDRWDRRYVLLMTTLGMALLALAVALLGRQSRPALFGLLLFYGGLAYTVYPLCVNHANDHAGRNHVVSVSAGLLLSWAAGSIGGPTLATLAMAYAGPSGLFFYVAGVALLFSLFTLWRIGRRAALPADLREAFVAKSPTTPAAAELNPRAGPAAP